MQYTVHVPKDIEPVTNVLPAAGEVAETRARMFLFLGITQISKDVENLTAASQVLELQSIGPRHESWPHN